MGYGPAIILAFAIAIGMGHIADAIRAAQINVVIRAAEPPTQPPPPKAGKTT